MENKVPHIKTRISAVKLIEGGRVICKPALQFYYKVEKFEFPFSFVIKLLVSGEDESGLGFSFQFEIEADIVIYKRISLNDMYMRHIHLIRTAQEFINNDERLKGHAINNPEITDVMDAVKDTDGLYDFIIE
jgi:hypothetical protein